MRRSLLFLLGFFLAGWMVPVAAAPDDESSFRVRYRSADTVYLEAGRQAGLSVGDRLQVLRDGEPVAVIEVVFTAGQSSSARLIEESREVQPGDLAKPLGPLAPVPSNEGAADSNEGAADSQAGPSRGANEGAADSQAAGTRDPYRRERRPRTRITGVASVDFESYSEDGGDGLRDHDRTTARLSLRGRNLGGLPLFLRIRLRSRQVDRARALSGGVPASEDRDRLYELSLRWQPEGDRWSLEVGRLGAGPFSGFGYLDGASGRWRLLSGWEVGAFYGQRPELGELGFDADGSKYGVFTRLLPAQRDGAWEVFVAGVHEEDDQGLSRELAVLESRWSRPGSRWSFAQRAEIDLGSDGEGLAGIDDGSGRLTQVALALTGRLAENRRVVLSYDRYDPVLLFLDDDGGPAQRFEDLLRQGLKARLYLGGEGKLGLSISAGLREGEGDGFGDGETTYTAGLGLLPGRWGGFTLGGDLLAFSNPLTEGALATLRARQGFRGGHSVGLTLGSTAYSEELTGEDRSTSWARFSGWVELPASLFARGEVEVTAGDDAEGQRLRLGLGYRF